MNVVDKYKQLGCLGFIRRIGLFLLRKLGVTYESYYYMINDIEYANVKERWEKTTWKDVKELTIEDFSHGELEEFTSQKLAILSERFQDSTNRAYGIYIDEKLVYSCWLSFRYFSSSERDNNCILKDNEVLLIDDFCSPAYRNRGIHGSMNLYRLKTAYECGKSRAVVLILNGNRPAFKSQIRVGFKVAFKYYTLNIGGKYFSNFNYQKKKFYE